MSHTAMSFLSCLLMANLAIASEAEVAATPNPQRPSATAGRSEFAPLQLSARGPGALFASIDAAAIDALTYAYLQARAGCEPELMSGGTIHAVADGTYSYSEVHRAKRSKPREIDYILKPQDVARFHLYPASRDDRLNRINERPSPVDRRSVSVVDPLHRPLYILHPSLAIRAYRGEQADLVAVASLHSPVQPKRFAGKCSSPKPSLAASSSGDRVAGTPESGPRR